MTDRPSWLAEGRRRVLQLGRWASAHALVRLEEYTFDYVAYPFMLYGGGQAVLSALLMPFGREAGRTAGFWVGFAALTVASILINLAYVRAYDRLRTDWFGFEALKDAVDRIPFALRHPSWSRAGRYISFAYLSTWHSPLFAVLFMRRGARTYEMSSSDWRNFWVAVAVANAGWAGLVSGAVEVGSRLLSLLR